jgi:hypothetical protein
VNVPPSIVVDDSHWPVVVSTHDGRQTSADVEHFIQSIDQAHDRRQPFVVLAVVRRFESDLSHVKRLGTWGKNRSHVHSEMCKGVAIVLTSSSARFLVSSFFLIFVPPFPFVSFDDVGPAVAWLRRRLVEVGLPVPASLATLEERRHAKVHAR